MLNALIENKTNAEIGVRLQISPETVKWHVSELLAETGSADRQELAAWWQRRRHDSKSILPPWLPRPLVAAMAVGGVAAVIGTLALMAMRPGKASIVSSEISGGPAVVERGGQAQAAATTTHPPVSFPYPPFFVQAKDQRFAPTVRLSGGDLPHPIVIPVVDYKAATNMFSDTRNAWWTRDKLPGPPDGARRYRLEFVAASPDLSEVRASPYWDDEEHWYAAGEQPLVGPMSTEGWFQPNEFFDGMVARYVAIDRAGLVPEKPTLEQALLAAQRLFGARVAFGQTALDGDTLAPQEVTGARATTFLRLLGQSEIAMFGVRGDGIVGRVDFVPVEVWFGELRGPTVQYILAGDLAPYGFLMARRHLGAWAPISTSNGQAWSQEAFRTPEELDAFMASLGYHAVQLQGSDEDRMVTMPQGTGDWRRVAKIEVWKGSDSSTRVSVPPPPGLCEEGCDVQMLDPPSLADMTADCTVEITPVGMDPFPEAVVAPRFNYYAPTDARPGILEQYTGLGVANAQSAVSAPIYVPPEFDHLLSAACANLP